MLSVAAIAVFGIISYGVHSPVNPITHEKQHVALSAEQEVQLGLQSAPQMAAEMGGEEPDRDPRTQEVRRIGSRVIANTRTRTPTTDSFQFLHLDDTKTRTAFVLA